MTSEKAALIQKARASLDAARLLAKQGHFDFAVSRAYYAMFYVAEALLLDEGLVFSKHSAVIARLRSEILQDWPSSCRISSLFDRGAGQSQHW